MIQFENVRKAYRTNDEPKVILKNLTLTLPQAQAGISGSTLGGAKRWTGSDVMLDKLPQARSARRLPFLPDSRRLRPLPRPWRYRRPSRSGAGCSASGVAFCFGRSFCASCCRRRWPALFWPDCIRPVCGRRPICGAQLQRRAIGRRPQPVRRHSERQLHGDGLLRYH
jgi:hypothetical protein